VKRPRIPTDHLAPTTGAFASHAWVRAQGSNISRHERWRVRVFLDAIDEPPAPAFDAAVATRFHLEIFSEEWGFFFCHAASASWIRVTDIAFVHGRDDFKLLPITPPLKQIGSLLRRVEQDAGVHFRRHHATIETNLDIEPAVRSWVASL
jgi:hypothetical protein